MSSARGTASLHLPLHSVTDRLTLYGVLLLCAGNDNLHLMTSAKPQRLRVVLGDWEGNTAYVEYSNFTVGSAEDKYRLVSLGTHTGRARKKLISL